MKKLSKKEIFIIIVLSIFFIILGLFLFKPNIYLIGDSTIKIDYNSKYKDPGVKVKDVFNNEYDYKIKVKSNLNTKKLGTYKIEYKSNKVFLNKKRVRTIKVIDRKKPKITLNGKKDYYICPNSNYIEPGYNAYDDYDKDLTNKVEVIEEYDKKIYKVQDSSNNKVKVIRNIIEKDIEKPSINLIGSSEVHIAIGGNYKEEGYEVLDNCDGNLSKMVKIKNNVDYNKPGTYEIEYSVSDNSLNETIVKRKVVVESRRNIYENKTIYLTFDDGPSEYTEKILDILKSNNIKATFFVTNHGNDEIIKRENDEGHTIGIHTASHNYSYIYFNKDNFFNDFNIVKERIKRITGNNTKYTRFPGGSNNTVSNKYNYGIMNTLKSDVTNNGYIYIDWNISGEDAGMCSRTNDRQSCIYHNVVDNLRDNISNVVLLHDTKIDTLNVLNDIVKTAKERGFIFRVIDDTAPIVQFR